MGFCFRVIFLFKRTVFFFFFKKLKKKKIKISLFKWYIYIEDIKIYCKVFFYKKLKNN